MKTYLKKIMKENFSNLAKEINCQEVQEAQRVPKKLDPRRHTPRHIIITLPKIKDKALPGVAQWIEHVPVNRRVTSSIPSLGHMLGLWARSPVGGAEEATTH